MGDLRRQATRFMAGTPGAKRLRVAMQSAPTPEALREIVAEELARADTSSPGAQADGAGPVRA
jgi:hypothetical protein